LHEVNEHVKKLVHHQTFFISSRRFRLRSSNKT